MGTLANMINNNEITLNQFFTMHPFSATEKIVYNAALEDVDFFEELYVRSNKTYERLITLANIANNTAKNTIVITGYRGCGKTNFMNFVKHIFEGGKIELFSKTRSLELEYAGSNDDLKEEIKSKYEKSIEEMRTRLSSFGIFFGINDENMDAAINQYIQKQLRGTFKYINFDEGGGGREKPFSTKLYYLIRAELKQAIENSTLDLIIARMSDFVERNQNVIEENFQEIEYTSLEKFWITIINILKKEPLTHKNMTKISEELKKLTLEQLFFSYTIWEYAVILSGEKENVEKKLFFVLDNIDIVSDETGNIFINTMTGIWNYIWDSRNVFVKISESGCEQDKDFVDLYFKTKYIVAMRETTAMHMNGHMRERMQGMMNHFDMSPDVNKAMILDRKIDYAFRMYERGELQNRSFMEAVKCIRSLLNDPYLIKNIFLLFNEDYRTAAKCISVVCASNLDKVKKAIQLMNYNEFDQHYNDLVFGGRGIIYGLLADRFLNWGYFDAIGVPSSRRNVRTIVIHRDYGFTCARVILTLLCNQQVRKPEYFFVNPEESVRLADLYSMLNGIIEIDDFVKVIDGMFSLRNHTFWDHLITFDNILSYSPDIIKKFIEKGHPDTEDSSIYIRATSAGMFFADVLSVHFEYYSCRFTDDEYVPLFLMTDLYDTSQLRLMKKIVRKVYRTVGDCCRKLENYNKAVMDRQNQSHYNGIISTSYYITQQFHEERIIHNHISYLEAYRNYILILQLDDVGVKSPFL